MAKKNIKQKTEEQIEETQAEVSSETEDLKNQIKRTLADYQNLEKRVASEREEFSKSANRQLILRLLPALDTLILALKHTQDEGLKISVNHIFETLEKEGLKKIETEGKEFDPMLMEGIQAVEGEEGKVIEELKQGYFFNEKVLRPAQVSVGQGS